MSRPDTTFKEFKNFAKCMRFLRAQDAEPPKGSNERKNFKMIFEQAEKNNAAVGVMNSVCHCGSFGDNGMIIMLKKDSEDYQKHLKDELEPKTMMCPRCMDLSKILASFNLEETRMKRMLSLLWHYKTGGDGWYEGVTIPEEWQEEVAKEGSE